MLASLAYVVVSNEVARVFLSETQLFQRSLLVNEVVLKILVFSQAMALNLSDIIFDSLQ